MITGSQEIKDNCSVVHLLSLLCLIPSTVWLFPSVVQEVALPPCCGHSCHGQWSQGDGVQLVPFITSSFFSAAPAQAQIIHAGQACVVKEDNISERVYTIREGDTLVLQCLVTGHPRPQVRLQSHLSAGCPAFSCMLESRSDIL